jgi:hypothetical protein
MKAIETIYKGYRFRSRLEARWAVFWDALGIKWEYEPEGYELSDGTRYLPDFWLPQVKMYGEVKPGDTFDGRLTEVKITVPAPEWEKMRRLAIESMRPVLLLIGVPTNTPYLTMMPEKDGKLGYELHCLTTYHGYPYTESRFYASPGSWAPDGDAFWKDTEIAANAARQARFEHGEHGVSR